MLVFLSCDRVKNTGRVESPPAGVPEIEFETNIHDFGTVKEGEIVSYTFKYRNSAGGKLLITSASASCGCTVPKYSKEALAPGESGGIEVVFDTRGRQGLQEKTIAIRSNTEVSRTILRITANVQ